MFLLHILRYFVCFVPFLSSCHEKATVVLYFGRILTCLKEFPIFKFSDWFFDFSLKFAACSETTKQR